MPVQLIDGLSRDEVLREVNAGGRLVVYKFCISLLLITIRQNSDIKLIKAGENAVTPGLRYTVLAVVLGWWGIPWGPIFTIQAIATNLGGGKDVTNTIVAGLTQPPPPVASALTPGQMALPNGARLSPPPPGPPLPAISGSADKADYPVPVNVEPAWHADPTGRNEFRYWDGSTWTEMVGNDGQKSTDTL